VADGDIVRVFSARGAFLACAQITRDLMPGVIQVPTGAWFDPGVDAQGRPLCAHGNPNAVTRDLGTSSLNHALQERLNPGVPGATELARGERVFRRGDKVMQLRNDYDKSVFNGDIGVIAAIDGDEGTLRADFDGRPVLYERAELDQLVHAYAVSIHKSQGSEYPAVVLSLSTQHYMMLQRSLLYTGVTRGKRLVVIVGSKRAVALAVKNADARRRYTWLAERVRGELG